MFAKCKSTFKDIAQRGRGDEFTIGMFRIKLANSGECVAYRDNSDFAYGWVYDWARACGREFVRGRFALQTTTY